MTFMGRDTMAVNIARSIDRPGWMRTPARAVIAFIGLLICQVSVSEAQVWLGLGYDAISQEYFLITADTTNITPDSLATLRQTAIALDEGQFSLRTRLGQTSGWDQTTSITDLYWQHHTTLVYRSARNRPFRGRLQYTLNAKGVREDQEVETSPLSSYRVHQFLAEGDQRFGKTSVRLRLQGEAVRYPDPQELAYDYDQGKVELRVMHSTSAASYREITGSIRKRQVPDSSRVSYREAFGRFALGWGTAGWRFSAALEGLRREYDVADAGLDHNTIRVRADWVDNGITARWIGSVEMEQYDYFSSVSILSDILRMDIRQRYQVPLNLVWTPFVEPGLEFVHAPGDDDYFEPRVTLGTEFFRLDGWWANADVVLGYRNYNQVELDALTDYWRIGLNLLVDGPITSRVSLNLFYSQEWERHTEQIDNFSVVLFSAGLKYRL